MRHFRFVLLAVSALVVLLSGCGDPYRDDLQTDLDASPSHVKQGKVCEQLAGFLETQLSVGDVQYSPGAVSEYFDKPIEWTMLCRPSASDKYVGLLQVRNPQLKGTSEPANTAYAPATGFSEKAWIAPGQKYRTQVGSWVVELEILEENITTPTGKLVMTDELIRKTIEFMIDLAREVQQ